MTGCWYLFTAGNRGTAPEVVSDALAFAEGELRLQLVLDRDRRGLAALMEESFVEQPGLDFYGWLADDTYPRTPGWNVKLAEAAMRSGFACADDGGYIDLDTVRAGADLSSGLCWAGWLLRSVGWWAAPGLRDAWVDVAWLEILRPLGLIEFVPGVLVEHRHWRTGKRERDVIDSLAEDGIERDREAFHRLQLAELPEAVRRAEDAMAALLRT